MKRLKVAAMLLAMLLAPAVAQAAAWTAVPSPSSNELHAMASVSANDVWAVGVGPGTAPRGASFPAPTSRMANFSV